MNKKIFIIEDDINILSALQAKLSHSGLSVAVNSGINERETIIREIINEKPDYIILDVILPLIDGFKLLRDIKANDETGGIPVFIFTDFSENDLKAKCDNLGADYYFLKNELNIDQFTDKIGKIMRNREKII
jgi:DNA-binding response OmpR family regulator